HSRVSPLSIPSRRPPRSAVFPYTTLFRSATFVPGFGRLPLFQLFRPERPGSRRSPHIGGPRVLAFGPFRRSGRCRAALCRTSRRSEEHTSELQSRENLVCRLLLAQKKSSL